MAIVIGAGASCEIGLPTGTELKQHIQRALDIRFSNVVQQRSGDAVICAALREFENAESRDLNRSLHAAWKVRDALPLAISIDNFVDAHSGDVRIALCAKLAVVQCILDAERSSALMPKEREPRGSALDFGAVHDCWFSRLWRVLSENCSAGELRKRLSEVVFISFNYDRCLEQFLFHAIQVYYGLRDVESAEIVRGARILHPYGTVGELAMLRGESVRVGYGDALNGSRLLQLSAGIRTFVEGTDPSSSSIVGIHEAMREARTVVFVGFAYHRLNMDLLRPAEESLFPDRGGRQCFATGYGMSQHDCELVRKQIGQYFHIGTERVTIRNELKCEQLFAEYSRSLSLLT